MMQVRGECGDLAGADIAYSYICSEKWVHGEAGLIHASHEHTQRAAARPRPAIGSAAASRAHNEDIKPF
jgi:hypothetical protein